MSWEVIGTVICSTILALLVTLAPWHLLLSLFPGQVVVGCLAVTFLILVLGLIAIGLLSSS